MFQPFEGFWDYYGRLATERISKAEVSRVIVESAFRGYHLGEVLMDNLVAYARELGFQRLFLACTPKHEKFYGRSGFLRIQNLTTNRFGGGVDVNAIAMDLDLDRV